MLRGNFQSDMLINYVECSNIGFSVWGGGHAIFFFIITLLFIDFFLLLKFCGPRNLPTLRLWVAQPVTQGSHTPHQPEPVENHDNTGTQVSILPTSPLDVWSVDCGPPLEVANDSRLFNTVTFSTLPGSPSNNGMCRLTNALSCNIAP